ncbi:MAG: hypothetical protein EP315_03320 [Gammaproteobacteria bacterium]|nr:MAG: hypothetical protein EP315_03320 [Gammaproteobacteria bacterium]
MLTQTETIIVAIFALWQLVVPLTYTITMDKASTLSSRLLYIFASIALSLLAMIFLYTILSRIGIIDFLASIDHDYANFFILLMVFICPLLIAVGYHRLQVYNTQHHD